MLFLVLAALSAAIAAPTELRAAAGGEINADAHGRVDLGLRRGPWSAELLTDTLDLRYGPDLKRGRAWAALRAEGGAMGLLISPWTAGAPDPGRALLGHQVGVEGGALRYLPAGLYAGAQGGARLVAFGATATTEIPVPAARPILSGEALAGWWRPSARAWLRAGLDLQPGAESGQPLSPHVALEAAWTPDGLVAPRLELRGGLAQGQDLVTRTRLGGLNPYVVPLAGAAWAEWWVEDYAALRAGPTLQTEHLHLTAAVDAAWFDGQGAVGFALGSRWTYKKFWAEAAGGYAPWIPRQEGVSPLSLWFSIGLDWIPLKKAGPEG